MRTKPTPTLTPTPTPAPTLALSLPLPWSQETAFALTEHDESGRRTPLIKVNPTPSLIKVNPNP